MMTDVIQQARSLSNKEKQVLIIKLRETADKLEKSISLLPQSPGQQQVRQVSQSSPHR